MEFKYNIESKHIVWLQRQITIQAATVELANSLAIHATNMILANNSQDDLPDQVEITEDVTMPYDEPMTLTQNGGNPTIEISRIDTDPALPLPYEVLVYDNLLGINKNP